MYGSLGFVDQDRRAFARDNAYLGASGHPSRKEMTGAVRPQESRQPRSTPTQAYGPATTEPPPAAASAAQQPVAALPQRPVETAVMAKRCEFLEAQDKRKSQEISELRTFINSCNEKLTQVSELAYGVTGRVALDAPTATEPERADGEPIAAGQTLKLVYPMRRVNGAVWMRYRQVDPKTAQIEWRWVMLFREKPEQEDEVFVTDFD